LSLVFISGKDFVRSVRAGCKNLELNRDKVDLLNVFPVPDGDTGTNMYLTLLAAVKEGEKNYEKPLGQVAKAVSRGSLMGARGNSGVILSQVFRGMARILENKEKANAADFAMALQAGSDTAYEAVMKPVEGTILTVVREIAKACEAKARKDKDIITTLMAGIQAGHKILKKTPEMLPILKESGVIDAGGQGFLYFLEGFIQGLDQEHEIDLSISQPDYHREHEGQGTVPGMNIEFQYCTELLIIGDSVNIDKVKNALSSMGDSMMVVGAEEVVKVHIHSNHPGKVLETCMKWGSLTDIKINNMVEEAHEHMLNWQESREVDPTEAKPIGLVTVGIGDGIIKILESLGADVVVEGGQTMNPSTEDLLNACKKVNAENIFIMPNNSNVIMAANQVAALSEKPVRVVPTKSVMQCITALVAFHPSEDVEEVYQAMLNEIDTVKYAEVTRAIRNTCLDDIEIAEGDAIGILQDKIVLRADDPFIAVLNLLEMMVDDESELITILFGQDITEGEAFSIKEKAEAAYPDCEIELHYGGQPHYSFLISVE
jgi:DAK2 domain fusion protein YloV